MANDEWKGVAVSKDRESQGSMDAPAAALRKDISDLGHMLGDTLVEQEGVELLELEESIRALAKERRKKGRRGPAAARMHALIAGLDTKTAERVARAFTHYFQLVNLSEQHHRTRRRHEHARQGDLQLGSLEREIALVAKSVPRDAFEALLARTSVELVFTAHPSEAQRRTVLDKERHVAHLLLRRDRLDTTPAQNEELTLALREEITTLWQTDELRTVRPRVGEEVKNTLFYLEEVLFPLIPKFYAELERATRKAYGEGMRIPCILHFGSWVGADMDGNPNVTPEVALDTAYAQASRVIALYLREIDALGAALSQSTRRTTVSEELAESITKDAEAFPELANELASTARDEPYRKKLRFMKARLEARHAHLVEARRRGGPFLELPSYAYATPAALLADLDVIARSLDENRGALAGRRRVCGFHRQIETFGFHLAKLDVRVPAAWVREAVVGELLKPEKGPGIRAMEAIANIQTITAGQGAESFILSMSHGADDMRASLVLARACGLYRPKEGVAAVSIVPLFEMLDDLERAAAEVERASAIPEYREYLALRGGQQELMVGYSDSNKDAGILSSSFALYRAQQELVEVAKRSGLKLKIFHGRGGSIGRGGGPSQRAIESLPTGAIDGRFKLTEQGEVLGWKYLLSEIAERNLEVTTSGVLRASSDTGAPGSLREFEEAFAHVADDSLEAYRALVHDPNFVRYYEESTPLDEIAMLNIGSRPAHRKDQGQRRLEDLRAIPWVFAWTQSRQLVPGWFGAGRALTRLIAKRGIGFVRAMREKWPFFASTLEAIAVSLAVADMDIGGRYASLVRDRALARRLFTRIALDHGRAVRAIRRIFDQSSLLGHAPTLERSIALRNPYVDPLSFIQIELLRRKRAASSPSPQAENELERAVLLTINGIAAGLRNTG